MKKTIWIDLINVPHVHFFRPIYNCYKNDYKFIFTVRDFAETIQLFEQVFDVPYEIIGGHAGKNRIAKAYFSFKRFLQLNKSLEYFDIRMGIGGDFSCYITKIRKKKSIIFGDNELGAIYIYSLATDCSLWPKAIPINCLTRKGLTKSKIFFYDGFKEDLYLANYTPNPEFLKTIPFDNYIILRPENIFANYVDEKKTITPEILKHLTESGYNILYLPRYEHDQKYLQNLDNSRIFVPEKAINGLDAVYYAQAVLTGAGTLAREAAVLGIPALSFFTASKKLSVDIELNRQGRLVFSRDVEEIITFLKSIEKSKPKLNRSVEVQKDFFAKLDIILSEIDK